MDYEKDDIIEFDSGEYLVLNVIKNNNKTYLCLINNAPDKDDVSIVEAVNENGVTDCQPIEDDETYNYVVDKILLENQELLKEEINKE